MSQKCKGPFTLSVSVCIRDVCRCLSALGVNSIIDNNGIQIKSQMQNTRCEWAKFNGGFLRFFWSFAVVSQVSFTRFLGVRGFCWGSWGVLQMFRGSFIRFLGGFTKFHGISQRFYGCFTRVSQGFLGVSQRFHGRFAVVSWEFCGGLRRFYAGLTDIS